MLHDDVKPAPDWRPSPGSKTAVQVRSALLFNVEIFDGDERITAVGHTVRAHNLHALKSLRPNERHAGVVYGAIMEELTSPVGAPEPGVYVQSGSAGAGCAIDRRLSMIELRDTAWQQIQPGKMALNVTRRARAPQGVADLCAKRSVGPAKGEMIVERRPILARTLVDRVCIGGQSICTVLEAHGWKVSSRSRQRLTEELGSLLAAISDAWNGTEATLSGGWAAGLDE